MTGSADAREKGEFLMGTPSEVTEQIATVRDMGFGKLQLVFLNFPDTAGMETFGDEGLPRFA